MITNSLVIASTIAIISIIWAEFVRDVYHLVSHLWKPLYRLHSWHHRIFKPDLSVTNENIYRQANWFNDLPESLVMLLLTIGYGYLIISLGWISPQDQWLVWTGAGYTFLFTLGAIARGFGVPYAHEVTDVTHRQGEFRELPANWLVNRTYHWRHHFDNQDAYFCGTFTFVDRIVGTALSLKGKKIAITGAFIAEQICKGAESFT